MKSRAKVAAFENVTYLHFRMQCEWDLAKAWAELPIWRSNIQTSHELSMVAPPQKYVGTVIAFPKYFAIRGQPSRPHAFWRACDRALKCLPEKEIR